MIGGDTSTPPIWRTALTEFRLHTTSASGATDATGLRSETARRPGKPVVRCTGHVWGT